MLMHSRLRHLYLMEEQADTDTWIKRNYNRYSHNPYYPYPGSFWTIQFLGPEYDTSHKTFLYKMFVPLGQLEPYETKEGRKWSLKILSDEKLYRLINLVKEPMPGSFSQIKKEMATLLAERGKLVPLTHVP